MNCRNVNAEIVTWLEAYKGFVVGISGGIDSALVSTLCAETNLPVLCVSLPIHQPASHLERAHEHINWLKNKFENVSSAEVDLTNSFEEMKKVLPKNASSDLALVNLRSRLRMATLYTFANTGGYVVAGTGNKVEDYGVAFFSKYGDGGVDISPIGDLLKTEVWELAKFMGINKSIIEAKPTDGLWEDDRSDEDQIGATYPELEWAMEFYDKIKTYRFDVSQSFIYGLNERQKVVFDIYKTRHEQGLHKMSMPPICKVTK
jgi:NAD+ synthase